MAEGEQGEAPDAKAAEPGAKRSPLVGRAIALVGLAVKFTEAYKREDLGERLEGVRRRLEDPEFHVLVVGEFKQGKSTLVNALLEADICPVDDDIATAVPTTIRWSERPTAAVLFHPPEVDDPEATPQDPTREEIPVDDVVRYATENTEGGLDGGRRIHSVEVGLPIDGLADGMVIVDTPGVGGLGSSHSTITMGALPFAEAVLFVSDAGQEFTAPELEFMERARELCPNLVCVQTKIDFYPAWRRIVEINRGHLDRLRITTPILAVSSTLHQLAGDGDDAELDEESGFPALRGHLATDIVGHAEALGVGAAVGDVRTVVDQLEDHFQERKAVLDDPEGAEARVRELEAAKARADELKSRSARWQQTLTDGGVDLTTEVDHDLRMRFRRLNQQVDEALEEGDPAAMWADFEPWLYRRVAEDVVANYGFLLQQSQLLAQRVAGHFDIDRAHEPVAIDAGDPDAVLAQVGVEAHIEVKKMGLAAQAQSGLRGGYVNVLMFGALAGAVGLTIPVAWLLAPGLVVFGRKALKDDKGRMLTQQRAQAKAVQRKFIEEVTFLTGKDSRDSLRRINRQLRDHFQVIAEEQARSTTETLEAVQVSVRGDQATRKKDLAYVEAELKRVADLRARVDALAAASTPG